MNFPLSVEKISEILGECGPLDRVRANWPLVETALDRAGVYSEMTAVAAIATISVETGRFSPIREQGGPAYLARLYEGRKDLGNNVAGDGVKFRGRGFIQITGRWDYQHFGGEIGTDLIANPDAALNPSVAAMILAIYFRERQIHLYADQQNWKMVREKVDGGLKGWPRYIDSVSKLLSALKSPPSAAEILPEVTTI